MYHATHEEGQWGIRKVGNLRTVGGAKAEATYRYTHKTLSASNQTRLHINVRCDFAA